MKVAGRTDKADRCAQLLITEPTLMFLPSLKPGSRYHAPDANQGTGEHGQEVRHGSKVAIDTLPQVESRLGRPQCGTHVWPGHVRPDHQII